MLNRARSMDIRTGSKLTKTGIRVLDDSNVKYNWTDSITETSVETRLGDGRNDDVTGRPGSPSLVRAAAGETDRQYAAGENSDSPPSEGQSDYQRPVSIASDQLSSYSQSTKRDKRLGEDEECCRAAAVGPSDRCYDAAGPIYVNTSSLATDASDEAAGGDYTHMLDYSGDEDADNVYLSLLDIVSIEERQIQVCGSPPRRRNTNN